MLDDSIDEPPKAGGSYGGVAKVKYVEKCSQDSGQRSLGGGGGSSKPLLDLWNMLCEKQKVSIK